jgi:hypothetical protein
MRKWHYAGAVAGGCLLLGAAPGPAPGLFFPRPAAPPESAPFAGLPPGGTPAELRPFSAGGRPVVGVDRDFP